SLLLCCWKVEGTTRKMEMENMDKLLGDSIRMPRNIMHQRINTSGWFDYFATSEGIVALTIGSIIALIIFRLVGPTDSKTLEEQQEMDDLWKRHTNRLPGVPGQVKDRTRTSKQQAIMASKSQELLPPPPELTREVIWVQKKFLWRVVKIRRKPKEEDRGEPNAAAA
ncbi:unnamed protein product, partial [Heterosigma akashiwo]